MRDATNKDALRIALEMPMDKKGTPLTDRHEKDDRLKEVK